jgi:16S rRNA (guanine527-N7)-methyltransferase
MSTARDLPVLEAEARRLAVSLDQAALGRFAAYLQLLGEWRDRAGLTAITDPEAVQRRHFGEALALLVALRSAGLVSAESTTNVVDVGTGAGFPGLPMRIVEPALRLTLLEANSRRCRFLEAAVETLALDDVVVVQARAEDAGRDDALRGTFDLAVARALAPLAVLVEYALPLLREGGVLAAQKGSRADAEVMEARGALAALGGVVEIVAPLSLPQESVAQHVVMIRRAGPLDDRYPRRTGIPTKRPLR